MILNSFLINKILKASILSISIILSIFFIFSLLGNLGESYKFSEITYLSFITAIQILSYIPIFIFFLIVVTFTLILKSHNEFIIIAHYLSKKKIIFVFLTYILIFIFLELNKGLIIQKIENTKLNLIESAKYLDTQIVIYKDEDLKNYIIIKNDGDKVKEISIFSTVKASFYEAFYSNKAIISNNQIISEGYYNLLNSKITENKNIIILIENLYDFSNDKRINHLNKKKLFKVNLDAILNFLNILLVILAILLITIDKKLFDKNSNKFIYYLTGTLLIFYLYFVTNISLSILNNEFKYLSLILISIYLFKKTIHEKSY